MKNATANNIELCEIVITTKQSKTIIENTQKMQHTSMILVLKPTPWMATPKKSRLTINSLKVNYRQKSI